MTIVLKGIPADKVSEELLKRGIKPKERVSFTLSTGAEEETKAFEKASFSGWDDILSDPEEDAFAEELCKIHNVRIR